MSSRLWSLASQLSAAITAAAATNPSPFSQTFELKQTWLPRSKMQSITTRQLYVMPSDCQHERASREKYREEPEIYLALVHKLAQGTSDDTLIDQHFQLVEELVGFVRNTPLDGVSFGGTRYAPLLDDDFLEKFRISLTVIAVSYSQWV